MIGKSNHCKNLREAGEILDESIQILGYEPPGTVEAAFHQLALQARANIKNMLKGLEG